MPDTATSMSGPTAALGAHIELDVALGVLLGRRIRTLIRAGETSRQAPPADLQDALKEIADDRTIRPQVRNLASDIARCIEDIMSCYPEVDRITMTLERTED